MIARYEASELVTTIGGDGEVLVQGLRAGVLEGFRFRPDRETSEGSRGLLAAANRALRALGARARAGARDGRGRVVRARPGAELLWRGAAVARLVAGESVLSPQVDVLGDGPARPAAARAGAPAAGGVARGHLREALGPLFTLREKAPAGAARGLAFVLGEGLGAAARRAIAAQVAALDADDRRALVAARRDDRALRVFLPALQRPDVEAARPPVRRSPRPAARRRARRRAVRPNDVSRPLGFYLACGYLPVGPRAVRLDRLEHAAAVTARLSQGGAFVPPRELPGILGCPASEVQAVLSAMGYTEKDGRFERRRPPARRTASRRSA